MTRNVRSTANGVLRTNSHDTAKHEHQRQHEAGRRRQHDGGGRLQQAGPDDGAAACLGNAGADQAPIKRMGAARRYAEHPGEQVPDDRPHQRGKHNLRDRRRRR